MNNPFIQTNDLFKTYHMGEVALHALAGVSLSIEQHAFCLVIGPSGSGKSTLLHLLGGLDRPTSGKIRVGEQDIDTLDENALATYRRQTVGFVFQSFNLIPGFSAFENVAFPMRFANISRRQRSSIAQSMLQRVGLEGWAEHKPNELSGGQQQRVALARALVNNPLIILADEPTGNLDSKSGQQIMDLLAELHQKGTVIVIVSHDSRLVQYATQVINLLDGCLVNNPESKSLASNPNLAASQHNHGANP